MIIWIRSNCSTGKENCFHNAPSQKSEGFDSVNQEILLFKPSSLNISNQTLCQIKYYLNNHSQNVSLGDCLSYPLKYSTGVPQGSILGPLLFIPLICPEMQTEMYADDAVLYVDTLMKHKVTDNKWPVCFLLWQKNVPLQSDSRVSETERHI